MTSLNGPARGVSKLATSPLIWEALLRWKRPVRGEVGPLFTTLGSIGGACLLRHYVCSERPALFQAMVTWWGYQVGKSEGKKIRCYIFIFALLQDVTGSLCMKQRGLICAVMDSVHRSRLRLLQDPKAAREECPIPLNAAIKPGLVRHSGARSSKGPSSGLTRQVTFRHVDGRGRGGGHTAKHFKVFIKHPDRSFLLVDCSPGSVLETGSPGVK